MLMDIAAEEFSHLEIVGATITMLLGPINGELKQAFEDSGLKECSQEVPRHGMRWCIKL
jgi:Mn-containing catalase